MVYVSQLQQEAYAALRAVRRRMPVLLRAERVGRRGDCLWQIDASCGRRIKRECMAAAGVAAPTRAVQRELEAAGYPRSRIAYLPHGVRVPPPRTPRSQAIARTVLADAHAALQLADRATLAVAIGAHRSHEELDRLLTVWRTFAAHWPGAKLWLVGPMPDRRGVEEQIDRRQLAGRATAVGAFDQLDDLFAAADLFVAPSPHGSPVALLEAMAAGLPIVAAATAANRSVLTDQQEGLLVPEGDAAALLAAIARLCADRDLATRLAAAARIRIEAEFSLPAMADQHVTWFRAWMKSKIVRRSMKILHIIPSLDRAGAEKQMTLLALGLAQRQFDVHVCALTRGGPLEAELRGAGVPVTVIGKRWRVDPQAFWRLRRCDGAASTRSGPHLALCGQRLRLRGGPVVQPATRNRRPTVRRSLEGLARIGRRSPRRAALRRVAANSSAVRDFCIEHGLPAEKIRVIPNGAVPAPPSCSTRGQILAELGLPEKSRLIGLVGRLWPQKRVKDAIWAADLLKVIRDNVHLLIFGDGPHRSRLERFRDQVVIRDKVHFLGHRNDVPRFLPHFNVLWSTSGYEGQSNAVLEAMAAGVPVVASDIPGNRNLVVPDQTGYLAAVGHRAAFARWTNQILDDAALARRLGRAAQERAGGEFSVEAMVGRYVELYEELMSAGR